MYNLDIFFCQVQHNLCYETEIAQTLQIDQCIEKICFACRV